MRFNVPPWKELQKIQRFKKECEVEKRIDGIKFNIKQFLIIQKGKPLKQEWTEFIARKQNG